MECRDLLQAPRSCSVSPREAERGGGGDLETDSQRAQGKEPDVVNTGMQHKKRGKPGSVPRLPFPCCVALDRYLHSLSLRFLICKVGLTIELCEDKRD